jgi:hypothetical protein
MKPTDELLLVPRDTGFQAWRARPGATPVPEPEQRSRRGADWIALPARCLVSVPMHFHGVDAGRREAAAQLELEAAGFAAETAAAQDFELVALGGDNRDQVTTAILQVAPLPAEILTEARDARFAPSVAFQRLTPGELLLWREQGRHVLAVPHEAGGALHCQVLATDQLDADAAAEIRCILAALDLAALLPDLTRVVLQVAEGEDEEVPADFAQGLDLPVSCRREASPAPPLSPSRLVPAPVLRERQERAQRRMLTLGALAFVFVLVAALGAFAARVALRDQSLSREEARLDALEPELASIRDARSAWDDMRTAVNPEFYPVEALFQLVSLLPGEGIRITRFEVREDGMVLDGEASSLGHGIEFRDKLVGAEAFQRWTWDFPQPTNLPDGRATFRAEAREPDPELALEDTAP